MEFELSKEHGLGPAPIAGRASHTSDLEAFGRYLTIMRGQQRASTDAAFDDRLWTFVADALAACTEPVGYDEVEDASVTTPKGSSDVARMIERVIALGLFIPIHPVRLAEAAGVSLSDTLTELLYATRAGLMQMRWAPECGRCGSSVTITTLLQDLPEHAHCAGCHAPNAIDSLDRVMVTFTFAPEVLYILANNYPCSLSVESAKANTCFAPLPATNSGSGFRYSLGDVDGAVAPALPAGTYRMHCPVSMTDNLLRVERDATSDDEPIVIPYRVSEHVVSGAVTHLETMTVPHGRIDFDIFPDTRSFFVLWIQRNLPDQTLLHLPQEERAAYTSAAEVINHPAFHLFRNQIVPASAQSLSIGEVVLVFTDIVGSTDLYNEVGDGEALTVVRQHFQHVFRSLAARGRIVKTLGDSVMAAFSSGAAAISAVADSIAAVESSCSHPRTGEALRMRTGVHRGAALVIPVNGVNDYFGQAVNIAARIQNSALPSQCLISQDVLQDEEAQRAFDRLAQSGAAQSTPVADLKLRGIERCVKVRGLHIIGPQLAVEAPRAAAAG